MVNTSPIIVEVKLKPVLTFKEYQEGMKSTLVYRDKINEILLRLHPELDTEDIDGNAARSISKLLSLSYVGLGMGEVGEIQGKLKKLIRDSGGIITDEIREKIGAEIGDSLWYHAAMADELGLDLGQIAQANLDKLASRKERGVITGSGDNR